MSETDLERILREHGIGKDADSTSLSARVPRPLGRG